MDKLPSKKFQNVAVSLQDAANNNNRDNKKSGEKFSLRFDEALVRKFSLRCSSTEDIECGSICTNCIDGCMADNFSPIALLMQGREIFSTE